MIKIVITGSIGMGKSTTAKMFVELGGVAWRLYDVDRVVHRLYQKGGAAVEPIGALFPAAIEAGAVNRPKLAKIVLGDKDRVKQLEAIVHPLTAKAQLAFIALAEKENARGVIFDIPLFFETGGHKRGLVDYSVVVHTTENLQRQRTLAREGMSEEKFEAIKAQQMSSEEKCRLADFVIDTEKGLDYAREQVQTILEEINETHLT